MHQPKLLVIDEQKYENLFVCQGPELLLSG